MLQAIDLIPICNTPIPHNADTIKILLKEPFLSFEIQGMGINYTLQPSFAGLETNVTVVPPLTDHF